MPIIASGHIEVCGFKPAVIVIHGTFTITTALLLCLITRDRYLCIQSSRAATPHATKRKNILLGLMCFLVSLVLSSAVLLEFWISWFSARELYSGLFSMAFVVIAIYYQKLRKLVKEHERSIHSSNGGAKDQADASIQMNHVDTDPQRNRSDTNQQPNHLRRSQDTNKQNTGHEICHQDTGNDIVQQDSGQKQWREDVCQGMKYLDVDPKQNRKERAQKRNHRETEKQKGASSSRRSSINSSIIMLVGSFAFAYFPFAIVFTIHTINDRVFGKTDSRVSHAFVWANSFGYMNAVIDPLIYAFRCDPIGKELRRFIYSARRKMFGTIIEPHSETV